MVTQIKALTLKEHLKADKSLEDALNDDKKTRNKKNRGDKTRQKEAKSVLSQRLTVSCPLSGQIITKTDRELRLGLESMVK